MTVLTETPPVVASPSVTRERTVADVLLDAAALIEEYGWLKLGPDRCSNGPDPNCAVMAVARVAGSFHLNTLARQALLAFEDSLGIYPAEFNDMPGRTKQEVVAAFRKAAAES